MSNIHTSARPRFLTIGLTEEENLVVADFAGDVKIAREMSEVHPEEHDVFVSIGANFADAHGLFEYQLLFAPLPDPNFRNIIGSSSGMFAGNSGLTPSRVATQDKPARDFLIGDAGNELGLSSLIQRTCVPTSGSYTGLKEPLTPKRITRGFVHENLSFPLMLAGLLESPPDSHSKSSVFWLPDMARSGLRDWLAAATEYWRKQAPDVFPETVLWAKAPQWASPGETGARQKLDMFDREEEARRLAASRERARLTSEVALAEEEGEDWRRMLRETGDNLVSSIQSVFEYFGFTVVDSDSLPEHKDRKREDLRVVEGEWIALVEVKGYNGAAKSNDLQQIAAAAVTFAIDHGKAPAALWYIPNAQRATDPAQRTLALAGRDDDVAAFGSQHQGCLIEARDLFMLRQRVACDEMTTEAARALLRSSTGRLSLN
jgi:hypothetical protein